MITEIEKEALENYFEKYKSFFVTEYDVVEKKLYLRIWLEEDGVHFKQDYFKEEFIIPYSRIRLVTIIHNRLVISFQYLPFPVKTVHIDGYDEAMCDPSDLPVDIKKIRCFEKTIQADDTLLNRPLCGKRDGILYLIIDMFKFGIFTEDMNEHLTIKDRWLNWLTEKLHISEYKDLTLSVYWSYDIANNSKHYGLWNMMKQEPIKNSKINFSKKKKNF